MRLLIGHHQPPLPPYDSSRFDVRFVHQSADGRRPPETIAEMRAQCHSDWTPDVYCHHASGHFALPTDIESFPGLTVTKLEDWDRKGRALWSAADFFDMIVTDRPGCALLAAGGGPNARFARFYAASPEQHRLLAGVERDIDVLFVGVLNQAVWGERNRWLARLARLSDRYRILITEGYYGEAYTRLLNRAKIVFNRSVRGETNARCYEAPLCGALVFNEEENQEVQEVFADGVHCVTYNAENLEARLEHYLTHEAERSEIVEAAQQVVLAGHTAEKRADALFRLIEENRSLQGVRAAQGLPSAERAYRKAFQIYGAGHLAAVVTAMNLLNTAEREGYDRARLLEARAALVAWQAHYLPDAERIRLLTTALTLAREAVKAAPGSAMAQMGLGFMLLERAEVTQGAHPTGKNDIIEAAVALSQAADRCETGIATEAAETADIEGFGYPHWLDAFDAHIERAYLLRRIDPAAWARQMRAAIAWRCRSMLSDLAQINGQREEALRQAAAAALDLPGEGEAWLRLARNEALSGSLEAASAHYRQGLSLAPLTQTVWPELALTLVQAGRRDEAEAFVEECLGLIRAIPAMAEWEAALKQTLAQG